MALMHRPHPTKQEKSRIALVCGGSLTENNYFQAMAHEYGITARVEIDKKHGASPETIVNRAKEIIKQSLYESVFAVFDQDSFSTYLNAVKDCNCTPNIQAITSCPSVEYWFLCHFKYSTKPYQKTGKSPAENLTDDLLPYLEKEKIPYDPKKKKLINIYPHIKDKTDDAIKNAKNCWKEQKDKKIDGRNPHTQIYLIVEKMRELQKEA